MQVSTLTSAPLKGRLLLKVIMYLGDSCPSTYGNPVHRHGLSKNTPFVKLQKSAEEEVRVNARCRSATAATAGTA